MPQGQYNKKRDDDSDYNDDDDGDDEIATWLTGRRECEIVWGECEIAVMLQRGLDDVGSDEACDTANWWTPDFVQSTSDDKFHR